MAASPLRVALLLCTLFAVSALSQMTFSDGWEKRQHLSVHEKDSNVAMDDCNLPYSEGLMRIHQQMVDLYKRFKTCQKGNRLLGKDSNVQQETPQPTLNLAISGIPKRMDTFRLFKLKQKKHVNEQRN